MIFLVVTFLFIVILTAFVSILESVCDRVFCCCKAAKRPVTYFRKLITFNLALRFINETYMPFCLITVIATQQMEAINVTDKVSAVLTIF